MNNTLVSDIESKIDIVELVREYVPLKKSGANWKWLSPFKPEKTASFVVSPAKQIAYCFATNQWGGPLTMLMLLEKIEFREALQILAKRAGVELKTDTLNDARNDEKWALMKLYHEIALWYSSDLQSPEWLEARNYLSKRWLTKETIEQWWIGYSSDPREMFESMKKKWFTEKVLMDSGVFVSPYKDRFFGRVNFPIRNYRGEVIAFSGRTLKSWSDEAKYVNSPETLIFHKSDVLFGIDRAKQAITKAKKIVIVEGQMDVISLHQAGIDYAVGISGTALTESHVRVLQRLTNQIYLCLDRDSAGKQAIFRSIENLQDQPVDIYIIDIGEAKDPDEFLKSGGDFVQKIETAEPAISFIIAEGSSKYDITTSQGKKSLMNDVINHILRIHGNIEVDQALRLMAKKLDISLQTLYSEYNRAVRGQKRPSIGVSTSQTPSGSDYLATYIIGLREGKEIFLQECLFQEDLLVDADMSIIAQALAGTIESEKEKAYGLRFEELSNCKTEEVLHRELRELIRNTNQTYFRKLQKLYAKDINKLKSLLTLAREHHLI
jgi:DNA primase